MGQINSLLFLCFFFINEYFISIETIFWYLKFLIYDSISLILFAIKFILRSFSSFSFYSWSSFNTYSFINCSYFSFSFLLNMLFNNNCIIKNYKYSAIFLAYSSNFFYFSSYFLRFFSSFSSFIFYSIRAISSKFLCLSSSFYLSYSIYYLYAIDTLNFSSTGISTHSSSWSSLLSLF